MCEPHSFSYAHTSEITLRSLFMKYDENSDDELNEKEFVCLMKNEMGLDTDQVEVYLYLLDKNGSGTISFTEFKQWYDSNENLKFIRDDSRFSIMKSAIDLFKRYDADGSFALDRDELQTVIAEFGGNRMLVDDAMMQLDTDQDGKVSFQEFLKWLNWIPAHDLL